MPASGPDCAKEHRPRAAVEVLDPLGHRHVAFAPFAGRRLGGGRRRGTGSLVGDSGSRAASAASTAPSPFAAVGRLRLRPPREPRRVRFRGAAPSPSALGSTDSKLASSLPPRSSAPTCRRRAARRSRRAARGLRRAARRSAGSSPASTGTWILGWRRRRRAGVADGCSGSDVRPRRPAPPRRLGRLRRFRPVAVRRLGRAAPACGAAGLRATHAVSASSPSPRRRPRTARPGHPPVEPPPSASACSDGGSVSSRRPAPPPPRPCAGRGAGRLLRLALERDRGDGGLPRRASRTPGRRSRDRGGRSSSCRRASRRSRPRRHGRRACRRRRSGRRGRSRRA